MSTQDTIVARGSHQHQLFNLDEILPPDGQLLRRMSTVAVSGMLSELPHPGTEEARQALLKGYLRVTWEVVIPREEE